MTEIQPVVVPTKGTAYYFQITALNFVVSPTDGIQTYWQIFGQSQDEQGANVPGAMLMDGNLSMDQETYDQWGTDDEFVVNWGLDQLGFIKA